MSDPETKPASSPDPSPGSGNSSPAECVQLQLNILLIAVIVLSCTLGVFLWRQTRYIRRDLEGMKPAAAQVIQLYNQEAPVVDAFIAKVTDYARTHADFAPIAQKYQLPLSTNGAPAAAPKPAAPVTSKPAPAPAPAPVPKK